MNWKSIGIFSPESGLVTSTPSILLPDSATSEMKDVYFKNGEVRRYNKRVDLFDDSLGVDILNQYKFEIQSEDETYFMYFTENDIAYRDRNNDDYVYLTPIYDEGTVTTLTVLSGSRFQLDFSLPSGESLIASLKIGDYIKLGSGTDPYLASDNWYEIESIDDVDTITCSGVVPSGYDPADVTGGDTYAVRQTFAGLDTDYWVVDTYFETLIATNNGVDYPIYWDGTGQVEVMTEEFKCKHIASFGGRVVALYLIASGVEYPTNYRWSELDDVTGWGGTGSDAGEGQLYNGDGYITKAFRYRDYLYVFKSESIVRLWAVASDSIFQNKLVRTDLGTKATHSFIIYRDVVYFYCTQDKTFRRFDGFYDNVMSTGIEQLARAINVGKENLIQGYYVGDERQLCWAVPYLSSTTLSHIVIADLDYKDSPWSLIEMPVTSFGTYTAGVDLDWSLLPYDEWASWNWDAWLSGEDSSETRIDAVADSDGNMYQLNASRQDDGEDYESYIVFNTDMSAKKSMLPTNKRFLKVQFYMRDAVGDMTLYIKRDNENEWVESQTFDMNVGREINIITVPIHFLAKSFQVKLSTKYDFNLIGMIFWYIEDGDR